MKIQGICIDGEILRRNATIRLLGSCLCTSDGIICFFFSPTALDRLRGGFGGQVPGGSGKVPGQVPNHGFREGSGAGSERHVPGRFRSRFRITGSGKVPGQVPNHGFREGSGSVFRTTGSRKVPGQVPNHGFREGSRAGSERQPFRSMVPNHGFREGSGAGSEPRVPGRFRGRFRTTGSGKVPGQVLNDRFREGSGSVFRTTGSRKVPGQVPNHGFREGSGAGSERQVPGRFRVSFSNHVPNHGFGEGSGAGSDSRVPGRVRFMFEYSTYVYIFFSPTALAMGSLPI